ncbi:MAG: phospholipid carrier-dependent glycosyltransferase [Gammaproteobacteria bacterium]|nr:phospholipid carrier-dependent glycosyltransferase [Gammaproteobacteria bacterium]
MTFKNKNELIYLLALGAFFVAIMMFSWIGYYGSDDMTYFAGGKGWLNDFPYVGQNHWTLRHTIVIPMALVFALAGISEFALVSPVILYYIGLLSIVYLIAREYFDYRTSAVAVFLILTLPLMATQSTVVVPDFAEVFFCLLSLWLFLRSLRGSYQARLLILSGVAAGLGWLTRETVIFFLFGYVLLFLAGFRLPRLKYFYIGLGFFTIVAAEMLYFGLVEGNFLHRIVVDFGTHLQVDAGKGMAAMGDGIGRLAGRTEVGGHGMLTRTGNLSVGRLFDPLLVILANQEFLLFYFFAAPCAVIAMLRKKKSIRERTAIIALATVGLGWFFSLYLQIGMTLLPRYFMLPSVIVAMLCASTLVDKFWQRPLLLGLILCGFAVNGFTGVYLDNRNPLFAERALTDYAANNDRMIVTDPETLRRGGFLYEVAGVDQQISSDLDQGHCLLFHNPRYLVHGFLVGSGAGPDRDARLSAMSVYLPQSDWSVIKEIRPGDRWIRVILDALKLNTIIPTEIYRRIVSPNFAVTIYDLCGTRD